MIETTFDLGLSRTQHAPHTDYSEARLEQLDRLAEEGKADEVAQSFEKLFSAMLVKEMRRSLPEGFFSGGSSSDIYESWFDQHVGQSIAETGSLGFAEEVRASIQRAQTAAEAEENS